MRTRGYYREMYKKHIKRKKKLACTYTHPIELKFDGMYSKGKIHCSCSICASKTNPRRLKQSGPTMNWKHSDLINMQSMDEDLKEYLLSV